MGFNGCRTQTRMTVPESVCAIGFMAFNNCSSIEEVDFLGAPPSGLARSGLGKGVEIRYNRDYAEEWTATLSSAERKTVYAGFVSVSADGKALDFDAATKKPAKEVSLPIGFTSLSVPKATAVDPPAGLAVDARTGVIYGTPVKPGSYTATVTVKSAAGNAVYTGMADLHRNGRHHHTGGEVRGHADDRNDRRCGRRSARNRHLARRPGRVAPGRK
ncbi:MAG: putative Ig domain-containing protein [Kiritimatiellae bacterium]|nr:putative Ig domain-containing protein [Kiritimatiellia bacterium]